MAAFQSSVALSSKSSAQVPLRFESLWMSFSMPVLIGPPLLLLTGTIGLGWIGAIATVAGTFTVTRDNVHSPSAARRNAVALGLSVGFCACWVAIAWSVIAGLVAMFPEYVSD